MINITIYKNILYNRYKFPSYKIRYIKINMTDNVNNNEKYRSHCRTGSLFCLLPYINAPAHADRNLSPTFHPRYAG